MESDTTVQNISVRLAGGSSSNNVAARTAPKAQEIPHEFRYSASDDGINENLLVLLHGLGE